MSPLSPQSVREAYTRIEHFIHRTPIISSSFLNERLGHNIFFKYEGAQKAGAFKFRGALNAVLSHKERRGVYPERIVAFSSGNHAAAVALAGRIAGVPVTLFIPGFSSKAKISAAKGYGAEVILTETRVEAEEKAALAGKAGAYLIKPFDDYDVIAGQGTSCYEGLQDIQAPDAIFATCGGGGWLSGSFLAKELLSPESLIFGAEPEAANDAIQSLEAGHIVTLPSPPQTVADGARPSCVGEKTFPYLQKLDGMYGVSEEKIIYWTQWLNHLLKARIEPTSAASTGAAEEWLKQQDKPQTVLILLSGGNIDAATERAIWEKEFLDRPPLIEG